MNMSHEEGAKIAEEMNTRYPKSRLVECGVPYRVASSVEGRLRGVRHDRQTMWPMWCGKMLEALEPYREHEGLEDLIEFCETYAGNASVSGNAPGSANPQEGLLESTATGSPPELTVQKQTPSAEPEPSAKEKMVTDAPQELCSEESPATATEPDLGPDRQPVEETPPAQVVVGQVEPVDPVVRVLKLCDIRVDPTIQMRAKQSKETIDDYREKMEDGTEFPPGTVFYDGKFNWLADGFHRVAGAEKAGREELTFVVHSGDRRDAVLYAAGANTAHGLPRNNADKRKAVMALLTDDEWGQWSDREIARQCGVGKTLVGTMRKELSGRDDQMDTQRKVKRGDSEYSMNTENIGDDGGDIPEAFDELPGDRPKAQEPTQQAGQDDDEGGGAVYSPKTGDLSQEQNELLPELEDSKGIPDSDDAEPAPEALIPVTGEVAEKSDDRNRADHGVEDDGRERPDQKALLVFAAFTDVLADYFKEHPVLREGVETRVKERLDALIPGFFDKAQGDLPQKAEADGGLSSTGDSVELKSHDMSTASVVGYQE